jgi:hypothetical protein
MASCPTAALSAQRFNHAAAIHADRTRGPLICDQPARWASRRRRPHVTVDLTVADAHRSILTALNDRAKRATFAKEDDP